MDQSKVEYACILLGWLLAEGPKPHDEIKAYCFERGVSRFELKAARKELGVKTLNQGNTWLWVIEAREAE